MNKPDEDGCKLNIVVFHQGIVSFSGYYQLTIRKPNSSMTNQDEKRHLTDSCHKPGRRGDIVLILERSWQGLAIC
jgi:hypothetical protein